MAFLSRLNSTHSHSVKRQIFARSLSCFFTISFGVSKTERLYSFLTIKNVEKVATNILRWAFVHITTGKITTVTDACNDDATFRNACVRMNTAIHRFSAHKKWKSKNSMPCNHDAARNLLGICWVHTVFLLKPGCGTRKHRQPQVRRGWKQERVNENRQKRKKLKMHQQTTFWLLPLNASRVRMQPFSKVKQGAEDSSCSKKVQNVRWWYLYI